MRHTVKAERAQVREGSRVTVQGAVGSGCRLEALGGLCHRRIRWSKSGTVIRESGFCMPKGKSYLEGPKGHYI